MATAQEIEAMTAMESGVLSALKSAEAKARELSLPSLVGVVVGAGTPLPEWAEKLWRTDAEDAVLGALKVLRTRVDNWASTGAGGLKGYAMRGLDNKGIAYPVQHWLEVGNAFLSELKLDTENLSAAGNSSAVSNTVRQTVKDVKDLAQRGVAPLLEPWPLHWKVAAE